METSNVTSLNSITSKMDAILVDVVPEHSNSDISGSVDNEDLFDVDLDDENVWVDDWKHWKEFVLGNPLMIATLVGFVLALVLILITLFIIIHICNTNWPKLIGSDLNMPRKRLHGNFYNVTPRVDNANRLATIRSPTTTMTQSHYGTQSRMNPYDLPRVNSRFKTPSTPPPPPPLPPNDYQSEADNETAVEYFGPEYHDDESSTLSTRESSDKTSKYRNKDRKSSYSFQNIPMSEIHHPRSKRPESWDAMAAMSFPPREEMPSSMATFSGPRKKNSTLKMQIEERI